MALVSALVIFVSVFLTRPVTGELSQADFLGSEDPDVHLPTPQIIIRHGYPAETHLVKTADGYILEVHRIPHGKDGPSNTPRPVAFLQHGFLCSSADYIIAGPEKSYAYILADRGYDVWLGNARGNTYSQHHVYLNPKQLEFWDFSYHEMGIYDLPAVIDFILGKTGQKDLIYIGHSMGTTMFYILTSTLPKYSAKIRGQFSLAPIAFMPHAKSPIKYLTRYIKYYKKIMDMLGKGEISGQSEFMKKVTVYFCKFYLMEEIICQNYIFILCGFDKEQFNRTLLPVILGHTPAGASTKTLAHFAQAIYSGRFAEFDYGQKENMVRYGTKVPPEYALDKIKAPVSLYYAYNDFLSDPRDVAQLQKRLPNVINSYFVAYPPFNHLDFLYANDIRELILDRVLNDIEALESFDSAEQDAFFSTFTNDDLNIMDIVDAENEIEGTHFSKPSRACLINKFSHKLNTINNKTDGIPSLSDLFEDSLSHVADKDEKPKVAHPL